MSKLLEFFQDDSKQSSMSRLLCFLSFWPASYVVILTKSTDALGWYLGAYVVGFVGGKFGDALSNKRGIGNVDS